MARNVFVNDQDALRAIMILESTRPAGWDELKKALVRRVNLVAAESCVMREEVTSRWQQGRVQELCELLDSFASARETYESLNSNKRTSATEGF